MSKQPEDKGKKLSKTTAAAAAAKTTLGVNEFAIKIGATFDFLEQGTAVKVNPNGTITLTLQFTLNDSANQLRSLGDISDIDTAVFNAKITDYFTSGVISKLKIGDDSDSNIFLRSDRNDLFLSTTADKGRQGVG